MQTYLTPHFALEEFLTGNLEPRHVPEDVLANLTQLCADVLEPVRSHFGMALHIHSGWRPSVHNASIGGAKDSDHTTGRAADFHIGDGNGAPWDANTIAAFHWIRASLDGAYGQIILEDHRAHLGAPGKLWVHVAVPGPKHSGSIADINRVLVSHAPKRYEQWKEPSA